jgi:hypothetical protein
MTAANIARIAARSRRLLAIDRAMAGTARSGPTSPSHKAESTLNQPASRGWAKFPTRAETRPQIPRSTTCNGDDEDAQNNHDDRLAGLAQLSSQGGPAWCCHASDDAHRDHANGLNEEERKTHACNNVSLLKKQVNRALTDASHQKRNRQPIYERAADVCRQ